MDCVKSFCCFCYCSCHCFYLFCYFLCYCSCCSTSVAFVLLLPLLLLFLLVLLLPQLLFPLFLLLLLLLLLFCPAFTCCAAFLTTVTAVSTSVPFVTSLVCGRYSSQRRYVETRRESCACRPRSCLPASIDASSSDSWSHDQSSLENIRLQYFCIFVPKSRSSNQCFPRRLIVPSTHAVKFRLLLVERLKISRRGPPLMSLMTQLRCPQQCLAFFVSFVCVSVSVGGNSGW